MGQRTHVDLECLGLRAAAQGVVLISLAAYEPAPWIDGLVQSTLSFTESSTLLVLHLANQSRYTRQELARWNSSRTSVNPVRLFIVKGTGSLLYAHLLNARHGMDRWMLNASSSYFVMMASNMLWIRPGMELHVRALQCSVGREGWRNPKRSRMTKMMRVPGKSWSTRITADFYLNLTCGERWSKGKHAWSYHEGSFYPLATVMRFLGMLESSLSRPEILGAANFPEEFWLQAYTYNHESEVRTQSWSRQLCERFDAHNMLSTVPIARVEKLAEQLACNPQVWSGTYTFYAIKRFQRNLSNEVTQKMLRFSERWRHAVSGRAGNGLNVLTNASVNCSRPPPARQSPGR